MFHGLPLKIRGEDARAYANGQERFFLVEFPEAEKLLGEWYGGHVKDPQGTQAINQLVLGVLSALAEYERNGQEPDGAHWHDSQRALWEILRERAVVQCPACAQKPEGDSRFCSHCGVDLQKPKKCPCGLFLAAKWRYCPNCGEA
jgi:hypothetical protein